MKKLRTYGVSSFILAISFLIQFDLVYAQWYGGWHGWHGRWRGGTSVIYYPNYYYNPYLRTAPVSVYPYYSNFPTINSCPLQPSYFDANGNWIAPQRVCPTPRH